VGTGSQPNVECALEGKSTYRAGIDENGLGASLGPLVVTAVIAEVSRKGARAIDNWNPEMHAEVLGDSKKLVRHGDVRLGEAWARVLTSELLEAPSKLVELLSHVPVSRLQQRCPKQAQMQCWNAKYDEFLAEEELLSLVRSELRALHALGIRPLRVASRLVCTSELNARLNESENRFLVDLHSMEELIAGAFDSLNRPLGVVCGKVGSMGSYTRYFHKLNERDPEVVGEAKDLSHYRFANHGSVKFVRDADATDPLVMLASLVGKYLRELFVSRIGGHFGRRVHLLRKPSGYHDPVTAEFVETTSEYRRKSAFPSSCFERMGPRDT